MKGKLLGVLAATVSLSWCVHACFWDVDVTCATTGTVVAIGAPPGCHVATHIYAAENWTIPDVVSAKPPGAGQGYSSWAFSQSFYCGGMAKSWNNCLNRYDYFEWYDDEVLWGHFTDVNSSKCSN